MGLKKEYYSRLANQHFTVRVIDDNGKEVIEKNPVTGQIKVAGTVPAARTIDCSFTCVNNNPAKGTLSVFQVIVDPEESYHKDLLENSGKDWVLSPGLLVASASGGKHPQVTHIVAYLDRLARSDSGSSIMTEEDYRRTANPEAWAKGIESEQLRLENERLKKELEEAKAGRGSSKQVEDQSKILAKLENRK